jgi:hypothetical protein
MKNIYLLAIAFISLGSSAQTLVQSDLPFAGLAWTSGVDTNYADPIPPGGSSQNWDFSTLQYSYVDTSGFGVAAGTPHASTFPGANLAAHKVSTNEWTYFTSSSTGFYINGYVNDTITIVIDPPQMYVPVPFSYGDMHTNISRVVIDTTLLGFPAQIIINFHADFHADGFGSLTTPTATYPSTLRVKETMLETDSFMVDYLQTGTYTLFATVESQKTYFRWFQHGATANYILGIDADSLGTFATRSDYVMQWAVLGTSENTFESGLFVHPNPASSLVTIESSPDALSAVDFYNLTGEKILHAGDGGYRHGKIHADVSGWPPGIYFYTATAEGKQFRGKISVVR